MLPTEETGFFQNSSFFFLQEPHPSDLPTANEIYAAALLGYASSVSVFPSLSLAVKRIRVTSRHRTSAAEGQTLWALRQFVPEVRVPEVRCGSSGSMSQSDDQVMMTARLQVLQPPDQRFKSRELKGKDKGKLDI